MLVLKRKNQEQIIIDQRIEITILGVRGNRVRLGINAPPEVSILRGELERESRTVSISVNTTGIPALAEMTPSTVNGNIREDGP